MKEWLASQWLSCGRAFSLGWFCKEEAEFKNKNSRTSPWFENGSRWGGFKSSMLILATNLAHGSERWPEPQPGAIYWQLLVKKPSPLLHFANNLILFSVLWYSLLKMWITYFREILNSPSDAQSINLSGTDLGNAQASERPCCSNSKMLSPTRVAERTQTAGKHGPSVQFHTRLPGPPTPGVDTASAPFTYVWFVPSLSLQERLL